MTENESTNPGSTAGQWSGQSHGCENEPVGVTKADIEAQALQQETAININREADIIRGTSVYLQISNFIEFYGILYTLRVFAQCVADKFKGQTLYTELVGNLCSLYTHYSMIALKGERIKVDK